MGHDSTAFLSIILLGMWAIWFAILLSGNILMAGIGFWLIYHATIFMMDGIITLENDDDD